MSNENGIKFEIFTEQLFKDLGKIRARRNVQYRLQKRFSRKTVKVVQVDVQFYDFFNKYIVECKYLSNGNINDDVVNKVRKNMDYLGIEKAIIATNQDFHIQAKRLARKYGIRLYNGKKLEKLDYNRLSLTGMLFYKIKKRNLEDRIRMINQKKYPAEPVIQVKYIL